MHNILDLVIQLGLIASIVFLTWSVRKIAKFCLAISEGLSAVQELDLDEYE